jgi:hypothetical protein
MKLYNVRYLCKQDKTVKYLKNNTCARSAETEAETEAEAEVEAEAEAKVRDRFDDEGGVLEVADCFEAEVVD